MIQSVASCATRAGWSKGQDSEGRQGSEKLAADAVAAPSVLSRLNEP